MTFAEERAEVLTSLDKNKIIDFYKQYGLGDSVEPRHAILTESQLKSVVKRVVVKILNEIRHKR